MDDALVREARKGQPLSCLVIDSHTHIGESQFTVIDPGVEGLLRHMDVIGIDVSVVNSVTGCMGGRVVNGNDEVIEAVQQHADRIIGFVTVDPRRPDATRDELERCRDAGLRGVKVHDSTGVPYDDSGYKVVWEFAQENRWPLLAHTWGKDSLEKLKPRFTNCPDVTWMLGHAGCLDREMYAELAGEHPNVYLETCFSVCPRGLVEYFVGEGLAGKVLFGSDATFMDGAPQVGRIVFAQISTADKKKILGENARRIWGL